MKRIHELAKEQGVDSGAIIEILERAGLPASKRKPSSTITPEWERRLLHLCERIREAQERMASRGGGATARSGRTPAVKKTAKKTTRKTTKKTVKKVAKKTTKKVAKKTAKKVAKKTTKKTAKKTTKKITKKTAKKITKKITKKTAKKTTKKATRNSAKKVTKTTTRAAKRGVRASAAPKRYTEDEFGVPPAASELDAWVDKARMLEEQRREREVRETPTGPVVREPNRPLTAEEIMRAAGLEIPNATTGTEATTPVRGLVAKAQAPAAAPKQNAAPVAPAAVAPITAPTVSAAAALAAAMTAPATPAAAAPKAPARVAAAAPASPKAPARVAAAAPASPKAKKASAADGVTEGATTAKTRRPKRPKGRRAVRVSAEETEGVGLLGEIAKEGEEEHLVAAVGHVPDASVSQRTVPIGPRKKDERARAPGRGFVVGRGFTQNRASSAPRGGPSSFSDGRRGKRRFFNIGGGQGGRGSYGGRGRGGRGRGRSVRGAFERPEKVTLSPPVTVKDLSAAIGVRIPDIIRSCIRKGKMIRQNDALNQDDILEIGLDFEVEIVIAKRREAEDELAEMFDDTPDAPDALESRAPVITILGHVDHGKTTLLDRIRKTNVAAGEAGGITQKISAFKVPMEDGRAVVFVDTPGHAAFTEMRARGANVTDVVVLVVAADDGVMPQTEEAYNHAKAAGAPIVVAINKIDKPNANVEHVKTQLAALGLQPVDWGGDTEVLELSALKGEGVDELLETLALQAELLELTANPTRAATGTCLEATKSRGRGVVANLLVQQGTLGRGDVVVCGSGYGRVRAIFNDRGKKLKDAGPATPVEVIGLETVPEVSARFYVLQDLSKAKAIAEKRLQRQRLEELAERSAAGHVTMESLFARMKAGLTKEVRIVLKADSRGSIEVLQAELPKLSTEEVRVKIIHAAVGAISESDVLLADASDALTIGFNVVAGDKARSSADLKGVDIRTYRVIYEITEELRTAMEQQLEPEEREVVTASIEVRKTFKASAIGTIAGCFVTKGTVERSHQVRLVRDGIVKFEGTMASLRRHKDDAKEVREGFECGIVLDGYQDIKDGDRLEAFRIEKIARKLETNAP